MPRCSTTTKMTKVSCPGQGSAPFLAQTESYLARGCSVRNTRPLCPAARMSCARRPARQSPHDHSSAVARMVRSAAPPEARSTTAASRQERHDRDVATACAPSVNRHLLGPWGRCRGVPRMNPVADKDVPRRTFSRRGGLEPVQFILRRAIEQAGIIHSAGPPRGTRVIVRQIPVVACEHIAGVRASRQIGGLDKRRGVGERLPMTIKAVIPNRCVAIPQTTSGSCGPGSMIVTTLASPGARPRPGITARRMARRRTHPGII